MSFFKMFGGSQKKSKSKEKENASPAGPPAPRGGSYSHTPSGGHQQPAAAPGNQRGSSSSADDCVFNDEAITAEIESTTPFRGRKDRNLSISRSGRHKYRAKQRSTVISGELYDGSTPGTQAPGAASSSSPASPQNGAGAAAPTSTRTGAAAASTGANCRESITMRKSSSSGMGSSQPTAV